MDENFEHWARLYEQRHNKIEQRNVWLYLISTSIGNIAVVDYEQPTQEIVRKIFDGSYEKAERYFENVSSKIALGKL